MVLPEDHQAVEVESFQRADKTGALGRVQLRPVKGQKFPSNLLLEGNKSLMADYHVGTRFRVQAKVMSRAGGEQYLFSSWQWDVKVLYEPEPV